MSEAVTFPYVPFSKFIFRKSFPPRSESEILFRFYFRPRYSLFLQKSDACLLSLAAASKIRAGSSELDISVKLKHLSLQIIETYISSIKDLFQGKPINISRANYETYKMLFDLLKNEDFFVRFPRAPPSPQSFYLSVRSIKNIQNNTNEASVVLQFLRNFSLPSSLVDILFPNGLKQQLYPSPLPKDVDFGIFFMKSLLQGEVIQLTVEIIDFLKLIDFNSSLLAELQKKHCYYNAPLPPSLQHKSSLQKRNIQMASSSTLFSEDSLLSPDSLSVTQKIENLENELKEKSDLIYDLNLQQQKLQSTINSLTNDKTILLNRLESTLIVNESLRTENTNLINKLLILNGQLKYFKFQNRAADDQAEIDDHEDENYLLEKETNYLNKEKELSKSIQDMEVQCHQLRREQQMKDAEALRKRFTLKAQIEAQSHVNLNLMKDVQKKTDELSEFKKYFRQNELTCIQIWDEMRRKDEELEILKRKYKYVLEELGKEKKEKRSQIFKKEIEVSNLEMMLEKIKEEKKAQSVQLTQELKKRENEIMLLEKRFKNNVQ